MNYPRIVHAVFNSPWCIERQFLGSIFSVLHSRVFAGEPGSAPADPRAMAAAEAGGLSGDPILIGHDLRAGQGRSKAGRFGVWRMGKQGGRLVNHSAAIYAKAAKRAETASEFYEIIQQEEAALPPGQILHVFGSGILGKHLSSMDEMCSGGLSVDRIHAALQQARDDDKVSAVMLHLDTPGGICYGMAEASALVRQIREVKTVASFCDSLCASAGQWIVSGAEQAYITPSADVGSIGVYSAHVDYTAWCEKQGIKVSLFADGTYKGAGYPGVALTEEQKAKIMADVMACSAAFKADVRTGRGAVTIKDETMQGQCFTGANAVAVGLADTVVNDLEAALRDLASIL